MLYLLAHQSSTYAIQISYLVRVVFQWTVITLISNTIQVCIPLVYIVDILAVVPFIKHPCKSSWMEVRHLNPSKDCIKQPHTSWDLEKWLITSSATHFCSYYLVRVELELNCTKAYTFQSEFPLALTLPSVAFMSWNHHKGTFVCSGMKFWWEIRITLG